ncbi:MaoC family dehydratase N-terminal domain-containing protein (plasmid) [Rhodococcus sp. USK10]|uniref:FAS1-like dehydratase domain-containing protein n=1 Tax=Rhodococcus sp. USK10 TaxID=2789739 RepID=UPI001C5F6C88|nr:MaoC family dehydratase N-terminal domain-containing protein [Rhodococcus sp. USK10]QYB00337.1 MaoC family dehydratase N-terminal domain-containing protein [Rhodococcus sp. USK10]
MTLLLSDNVKAMEGVKGDVVTSPQALDENTLRRFVHATMDTNPLHLDPAAARAAGFDNPVAPPLWPMHSMVRGLNFPDPLDALGSDPDWDGAAGMLFPGLPPLDLPGTRMLNAGTEAEFYRLAEVGDVVSAQSEYHQVYEREGRSGPMVVVRVRTTYSNHRGARLAVITMSLIYRNEMDSPS